jgi:glycosyltransferase involved in cell wall biosynthesis
MLAGAEKDFEDKEIIMKKIALIVGYFDPNNLSALPRAVFEICNRNFGKFEFFIFTNGNENNKYSLKDNITVYELNSSYLSMYKNMKTIIVENNIDLINFHGSLLGSMLFVSNFKKNKIPIILNIYDKKAEYRDFSFLKRSDFLRAHKRTIGLPFTKTLFLPKCIVKYYLEQDIVKKIIVPSERLVGHYQSFTKTEIAHINTGMNFEQFSEHNTENVDKLKKSLGFSSDDKIIMYFGHSSVTRGIDILIQSFSLIAGKHPNSKLILVLNPKWSSTSNSNFIIDMVHKYIAADSVRVIIKHINNPEEYYGIADVVVLLYRFSGEIPEYPFVLLEAMATGKPVITTNIGAIPEIIKDNFNGVFINPTNEIELSSTLETILVDGAFSKNIGKNAQNSVKSFDWNKVAYSMQHYYGEI